MSTVSNSHESDCWCCECEPGVASESSRPQHANSDELLEDRSTEDDLSEGETSSDWTRAKTLLETVKIYLALSREDEGQRLESKDLHDACEQFVKSKGTKALIPIRALHSRVDYRLRSIEAALSLLEYLDISTEQYLLPKATFGDIKCRRIPLFEEFDSGEELRASTCAQNDCIWDFYHQLENWPLVSDNPESLDAMDQLWTKPRFYLAFVFFAANKDPKEEMKKLWSLKRYGSVRT